MSINSFVTQLDRFIDHFDSHQSQYYGVGGVALVGLYTLGGFCRYAKGRHFGIINAIHRQGIVWKTTEVEFLRAALSTNESVLHISMKKEMAHRPEYMSLLEQCMQNRLPIEIEYEQYYSVFPWRGETNQFITRINTTPLKSIIDTPEKSKSIKIEE